CPARRQRAGNALAPPAAEGDREMNRTIAALAVAIVAPVAWGQSWEFKLSQSVLEPGAASVEVVLTLDPGPDAYAVAGANFNVHASEEGWSNLQSRIPCWAGGCGIFPGTGDIVGSSVVGITLAQ